MSLAPDFAEALHGWRAWRLVESADGIRLHSIHYDAEWEPEVPLVAACQQRRRSWRHPLLGLPTGHEAPELRCQCGIHAASSRGRAAAYTGTLVPPHRFASLHAIGTVSLWGTVAEHTDGWRASFAYPREIFLETAGRTWSPQRLAEIAEALRVYKVPVTVVESVGRLGGRRAAA